MIIKILSILKNYLILFSNNYSNGGIIINIDIEIFRSVNNMAGHSQLLDGFGIFMARYSIYVLAIFLIFKWFQTRKDFNYRKVLILAIWNFITSELVGKLIAGKLYYHTQPFTRLHNVHQLIPKDIGNSYPSDHTIVFFSFLIILFIFSKSNWRYSYLFVALVVGWSRMFVGVHYPVDVLTGMLISIILGFIWSLTLYKSNLLNNLARKTLDMENKILIRGQDSN